MVSKIHLINVQSPLPSAAGTFIGESERRSFHQEEGEKELRDAEAILDRAGVRYQGHVVVGPVAETIAEFARQHRSDQIVMGSRGLGAIPNLLLGSVATKLLHVPELPVTLVR